jgi:hypothetical protein
MTTVKATLNALTTSLGSIAAGTQAACTTYGSIMNKMSLAMGAYNAACTPKADSCNNDCRRAAQLADEKRYACDTSTSSSSYDCAKRDIGESEVKRADAVHQCGNFQQSMVSSMQQIGNFAQGEMAAKNCADELASQDMDQYCKKNPTQAICQGSGLDCTKSNNVNSQFCICKANPNDPTCLTSMGSLARLGSSSAAVGAGSGTSSKGLSAQEKALLDTVSDGADDGSGLFPPGGLAGKNGPGGVHESGKGDGKGAPGGGGPTGPGGLAAAGVAQKNGSRYNTNTIGGLSGGGSGSSRFGSASGGPGSGATGPGGGFQNVRSRFDLKAYLPGGTKDPARGIAGLSGPDGITGPNGLSIWEKVTNRYNIKRGTLLGP